MRLMGTSRWFIDSTSVSSGVNTLDAGRAYREFTAEIAEIAEMNVNDITERIIGAAIEVHRGLGPGLLESAYEACLAHELVERDLRIERQKALPLSYKGVNIDCSYRIDLLVEDMVIVELKSVARIDPIHEAQIISYLKLSGYRVGLLINFNVKQLTNGIRRLVNELTT